MATRDTFSQLREYKWRSIAFPTTTFEVTLRHDLVQHKYPSKDGADVEAVGRAPLEFSAKIPFRNGIGGGPSETWQQNRKPLYPDQFREFFKACADRETGVLEHPEFGKVVCRIENAKTVWDATRRDGVDVDVVWVETIDIESLESLLAQPSPVSNAISNALALDDAIKTRNPAVPKQDTTYKPDFADTMRGLQGISDQFQVLNARVAGKINSTLYRIDSLKSSVEKSADVKDWPILQAIENLKAAANDIRTELVRSNRKTVVFYVAPKDMTLGAVSNETGAAIGDLVVLNPRLVSSPVIERGTTIRYYRAA